MNLNILGIVFLAVGAILFILTSRPTENIKIYRNYIWILSNIFFLIGLFLRWELETSKLFLAAMLLFANVRLWRKINKNN